jgi:hypothetical protein
MIYMSLDMFANMFSQRRGIDQSIASSVMNAIIGHMVQQDGVGNLFSSGNSYTYEDRMGGIQWYLSNLGGGIQQDHPLVQIVQQNAGIDDPMVASQYTQQAIGLLNEHAYNNPQGIHSLLGNYLGGGGGFGDTGADGFGDFLGEGQGDIGYDSSSSGNPLVDMFSQRHGVDQSIASSVMNAIIGHATQRGGIGSLFSQDSYDNYTDDDRMGGIQSALSNIIGGGGEDTLQYDHPLVQQIQQETGIQDPQEAAQYAQQAIALMNEHAYNNPQGLHSVFRRFLGGGL